MSTYKTRVIDTILDERMSANAAVLIEGPKACGKTETASQRARSIVRLDVDQDARQIATIDPSLVLEGEQPRLIDEYQLYPQLWDHVRRAADDGSGTGRFLLTGSATPTDDERRHSGAGRIATIRMRPMSLHELGASSDEVSLADLFTGGAPTGTGGVAKLTDVLPLLVTGGWPHQLEHPDPQFTADYLEATAHVDINSLDRKGTRRRDPAKILACIRSLARNVSTAAGERTIAADANLSRDAVRAYLTALERLLILEDQPAFNVHIRSSRNLRSIPHRHLVDPSLAAAALGRDTDGLLKDLNYTGLLFESMVVRDLRVLAQPLNGTVKYFHTDDHEIDIVIDRPDGSWAAIEVKLGGDERIDEGAASLLAAVASIDQDKAGAPAFTAVVTASGRFAYKRDDGVFVIPLTTLCP